MVVAEVRERLAVSKLAEQMMDMMRLNLKNLNERKLKNSIVLLSQTSLQF
jgi:hypothetical protein